MTHAVSSAFQFINVPTGVWIDERGRVVRPGEPAWTTSRTSTFGGKALVTEGEEYVAGDARLGRERRTQRLCAVGRGVCRSA